MPPPIVQRQRTAMLASMVLLRDFLRRPLTRLIALPVGEDAMASSPGTANGATVSEVGAFEGIFPWNADASNPLMTGDG